MNRKFFFIPVLLILLALGVSACFPRFSASPASPDAKATQDAFIAEAVRATATQMALVTQIADLQQQLTQAAAQSGATATSNPTAVGGEATLAPTETLTPVPTSTSTNTPVPPTATPIPTFTPVPPTATPVTPTATAIPCNAAQFVDDVSIPDGTVLSPGSTFTKTWRLKNVGACTWTTSYDLVFSGGDQMSAPSVVDLPGNVVSGEVIDVSVTMVAPTREGRFRGDWRIRDASGILFGVGKTNVPFYVDVKVAPTQLTGALDFTGRMCDAHWTNGSSTLPCNGAADDSRGYVRRVDQPRLESGYIDDEPVLFTHPQMIVDGTIRGIYPPFKVENGHHFVATIGCAYKATNCDVNFQLAYQIGSNPVESLKVWRETYDEKFAQVDVDLSSLAGKDVQFILIVTTNGSSNQDQAQWLLPRIVK